MPEHTLFETRFKKALLLEKEGDYMRALQEYNIMLNENPSYKPALVNLGSLYSRMNELDKAIEQYTRALQIEEDYLSWFNIGSVYYKKGENKKAVLALEKSKQKNKKFINTYLIMGLSFSKLKNFKAAETCFKHALSIEATNEVALTALALLYYEQKKHDKSLCYIEQVLKKKPGNRNIRKLKAKILYHLDQLTESAAEIQALKQTDEGYTMYTNYIASIPIEAFTDRYGSLETKIKQLENHLNGSHEPQKAIALSLCYLFQGETDKAIDCLYNIKNKE